MAKEYSPKM